MNIQQNVSLKSYNTFGIEATAGFLAEATSLELLGEILSEKKFREMDRLVLGGGSNILFTGNFKGLVIHNSLKGMKVLSEDAEHIRVNAMAGESWHGLVLYCIQNGFAGIENLSLIPGRVGAAPMQNIGAYGVELKDVFESLEAMEIATGQMRTFSNSDCNFGYRESVFKRELKDMFIITSVTLRLNRVPDFNISYGAIQQVLEEMKTEKLTIKAVSDAVIAIRSSKLPDPKVLGNAGSFFKNPEVPLEKYEELKSSYPNIPGYPTASGMIKLAAGWLIEQCGWKGKRIGNTGAHKDQALVLVNYGNATGDEVKKLAFEIIHSVKEKFKVALSPEVNII
jgi:UDP-N-acetylmuramate dehydrogenase